MRKKELKSLVAAQELEIDKLNAALYMQQALMDLMSDKLHKPSAEKETEAALRMQIDGLTEALHRTKNDASKNHHCAMIWKNRFLNLQNKRGN